MSRAPDLREIPPLPEEISTAALDGDLVLFIGAGISRLLDMPSWSEMAKLQLESLRKRNALNYSDLSQLRTLSPKQQLSICSEIAESNDLTLDLTDGLVGFNEENTIYQTINEIGCVCVTTNYDELLEPRYQSLEDGSEGPAPVNRIYQRDELLISHLDTPGTVIHLHGSVSDQNGMIVSTRDYLTHYDHPRVQAFLNDLFDRKTVLFLGYGLDESEILEHILRRGHAGKREERRRFALQGFYFSQNPLYENLYQYFKSSFGVHLLGFVRDHRDYKQQEQILEDWASSIDVRKPPLTSDLEYIDGVLRNG